MIDPDEALGLVEQAAGVLPSRLVSLDDACGLRLAQEVRADRSHPAFARAMMDGFAVGSPMRGKPSTSWARSPPAHASGLRGRTGHVRRDHDRRPLPAGYRSGRAKGERPTFGRPGHAAGEHRGRTAHRTAGQRMRRGLLRLEARRHDHAAGRGRDGLVRHATGPSHPEADRGHHHHRRRTGLAGNRAGAGTDPRFERPDAFGHGPRPGACGSGRAARRGPARSDRRGHPSGRRPEHRSAQRRRLGRQSRPRARRRRGLRRRNRVSQGTAEAGQAAVVRHHRATNSSSACRATRWPATSASIAT